MPCPLGALIILWNWVQSLLLIQRQWPEYPVAIWWIYRCQQLGCHNEAVETKWVDVFGEMEMNSYKSKNLSLLISKIPSIPSKNVCIEWIFSLMSSHWPEPQCGEHENRAAGQSEFDFWPYSMQFYHCIREGCPKGRKQLRKVLLEKKTERMKIFYRILGQKYVIF